jgi:hypothetical protein
MRRSAIPQAAWRANLLAREPRARAHKGAGWLALPHPRRLARFVHVYWCGVRLGMRLRGAAPRPPCSRSVRSSWLSRPAAPAPMLAPCTQSVAHRQHSYALATWDRHSRRAQPPPRRTARAHKPSIKAHLPLQPSPNPMLSSELPQADAQAVQAVAAALLGSEAHVDRVSLASSAARGTWTPGEGTLGMCLYISGEITFGVAEGPMASRRLVKSLQGRVPHPCCRPIPARPRWCLPCHGTSP